jgi:hypothetical protein
MEAQHNKKQSAPGSGPGTETAGVETRLQLQGDYIPSPADGQEIFYKSLESLPAEMREKLTHEYQKMIQARLTNGATDEDMALESLLPRLPITPARKILETDYLDAGSLIEGLMSPGVWFVYGKPKIGKSWLVSQIALAVSTGGTIFDKPVKQGKVLYIALEDGEKRLKKRMVKQAWPYDVEIDYMTPKTFRQEIGYLNLAGGKRLLAFIERHNYLLTVIDTFSRSISSNQLKGEAMTETITPYQEFCQAKDRYMIWVDHEPKRNEQDTSAITGLFGGIAKSGMADGLWRLYKERGKGAKIDIEGRDLEDSFSLKLRFDKSFCYWYSEGDAETIEITERRKHVLDALSNLGRSSLSQLEDATGQSKGNLHTRLQDLVMEGMVKREKHGTNVFYELLAE